MSEIGQIADILDRAADLIEPEGAWTQEFYAVSASGKWREPYQRGACRFCMVGAIAKAAKTKVIEIERGPIGKFLQDFLACPAPHTFNDGHSQAEVVAKLREAAALARGKAS